MRYVVGFLRDQTDHVLLVLKQRPEWQRDRINGIGGKIEPGETPLEAMVREWREEVGSTFEAWRHYCELTGGDYEVHFFAGTRVGRHEDDLARQANDVGERFMIVPIRSLPSFPEVIPNLLWLVPAAFSDPSLPSFTVRDQGIVEASHVGGISS